MEPTEPIIVDAEIVAGGQQLVPLAARFTQDPDMADLFANWIAGQRSEQTMRAYAQDWRAFEGWCVRQGIIDLAALTPAFIVRYRNWLKHEANGGQGYANATIDRMLTTVRQGLDYVRSAGLLPTNPAEKVKGYHVPNQTPRSALEPEQVRNLLAAPDRVTLVGARDYAILCVMLYLALRRSEVAGLTSGMFSFERGHDTVRITGKGEVVRVLPVRPLVMEAIREYLARDGRADALTPERRQAEPHMPLFRPTENHRYGNDLNRSLSPSQVWWIVRKHLAAIGVTGRFSDAHLMRVTAITRATENNAPLAYVKAFAGHSDYNTTLRYFTRGDDLERSAAHHINY